MQVIIEILFLAITITFLMAWGTIKKQRKQEELIQKLLDKCEKKVIAAFQHKTTLSHREIELLIDGTKASLFWSKDKVQITDARLVSTSIVQNLIDKKLLLPLEKKQYKLLKEKL